MDEKDYKTPLKSIFYRTIGKHLRHIIEFYELLIDSYSTSKLSYDHRQRDVVVEEDMVLASCKITVLIEKLSSIQADKSIELLVNYEEYGGEVHTLNTTFFRELSYNIDHTIHHLAIIRIGIKEELPHIILPDNFGVAASTIRFQKIQIGS
ncbi:MAG: hypothetical protein OHK0038_12860 [Flammeovirgaceae bacterium]